MGITAATAVATQALTVTTVHLLVEIMIKMVIAQEGIENKAITEVTKSDHYRNHPHQTDTPEQILFKHRGPGMEKHSLL